VYMSGYSPHWSDPHFLSDLTKAINGQYSAIRCYEQLAGQAPGEAERRRILEIRNDEIRHFNAFSSLYRAVTGQSYSPHMTESCPSHYREGLDAAFRDEQRTVDFYHEVADKAPSMEIRELFRRAAFDEQNHAVWFLYLMTGPAASA